MFSLIFLNHIFKMMPGVLWGFANPSFRIAAVRDHSGPEMRRGVRQGAGLNLKGLCTINSLNLSTMHERFSLIW